MNNKESYLNDFSVFLRNEKLLSENTIESYKRDINIFIDFLEENNISDFNILSESHINIFISKQTNMNCKPSTLARRISSLKIFFRFLLSARLIDKYILENIKAPKFSVKNVDYIDEDDIELLLAYEEVPSPKFIRDKAIMELAYATGMKASEIINLKVSDVNLDLSYINCASSRTQRIIPIASISKKYIEEYLLDARDVLDKNKCEFLFLNTRGSALTRQGFWKIIKDYAIKAGINKPINANIIRNSFAKHMLENGADIYAVSDLLGHSSMSSTKVYALKDETRLSDAYLKAHPRA